MTTPQLPVFGYKEEYEKLAQAVLDCRPVLVLGRKLSGKTTLVRRVLSNLHVLDSAAWIDWPCSFRGLLETLAARLIEQGDRSLPRSPEPRAWARAQTSVHLKGVLWTALERQPRVLVLDGIDNSSAHAERFLRRVWFTAGVTVIGTATSRMRLGEMNRLFWDPRQTIELSHFNRTDSYALVDCAAAAFRISGIDLPQFREQVVRACRNNPGHIVEMCRLATMPEYRYGHAIKFHLMQVDLAFRLKA